MKQTRLPVHAIKLSIYLDIYGTTLSNLYIFFVEQHIHKCTSSSFRLKVEMSSSAEKDKSVKVIQRRKGSSPIFTLATIYHEKKNNQPVDPIQGPML